MKIQDRKLAYNEYLAALDYAVLNDKAIQALNDAFDVTQEDIENDINDLIKDSESSPMFIKAAKFRILMEDLRDYRDSIEIKRDRSKVLQDIYNDYSEHTNETYIFPV